MVIPPHWLDSIPYQLWNVYHIFKVRLKSWRGHRSAKALEQFWNLATLLVHHKDAIKNGAKASVVYKIPCADCPTSYIGEAKRRLDAQVKERQSAVKHLNCEASALAEHA